MFFGALLFKAKWVHVEHNAAKVILVTIPNFMIWSADTTAQISNEVTKADHVIAKMKKIDG